MADGSETQPVGRTCTVAAYRCQDLFSFISTLFKNVPTLTSFEMSPFYDVLLGVALFLFSSCGRRVALRSGFWTAFRAKRDSWIEDLSQERCGTG